MSLEKGIERLFIRTDAAVHRPVIWNCISQFAIDPPTRFYGEQVARQLNYRGGAVYHELQLLRRLTMVQRLPQDEAYRAVWYIRTNPEAWSIARPYFAAESPEESGTQNHVPRRLVDFPERPTSFALPEPVNDHLDQLVLGAAEVGDRTTRKEVIAALIFGAKVGQPLSDLLHTYRVARSDQILPPQP